MSKLGGALAVATLTTAFVWPGSPGMAAAAKDLARRPANIAEPPRESSKAAVTFVATADTYVQSSTPTKNFGNSPLVVVDNSPVRRAYLKFTVSAVTEPVLSAKLLMHATAGNAGSKSGGSYRLTSHTAWNETGVTWNNQPAIDGATLGSVGAVVKNNWYELDVAAAVKGNGTFIIGVTSSNADGAYFDSRETANGPRLVLATGTPPPLPPPSDDPVLVGAGDIAACNSTGDEATAKLLDTIPGTVFTLGDNVYQTGSPTEFANCYEPSWGRHKARTRPAVGNHDYRTPGATGYYQYFGAAAGEAGKGYYSYDLGEWHVVALNSNCDYVSCATGSAQEQWLRADLAANPKQCTVAYLHEPLFTSGANHRGQIEVRPLYQALYDLGAELVIAGHNHQYERFAPQDPSGKLDLAGGMRQFVAGMGGASHYGFSVTQPNSEVRNSDTYGVLKLTLHPASYDWQFVAEAGRTFTDYGSGTCH